MNTLVQLILAAAATLASMIAAVDARAEVISGVARQAATGQGWHLQALEFTPVANPVKVEVVSTARSIWDLDGAGLPAAIIAPREITNPPASFFWTGDGSGSSTGFGVAPFASAEDEQPDLDLFTAHPAPEPPAIVMVGMAISAGAVWFRSRRRRTAA